MVRCCTDRIQKVLRRINVGDIVKCVVYCQIVSQERGIEHTICSKKAASGETDSEAILHSDAYNAFPNLKLNPALKELRIFALPSVIL